jgi:hypothetical protein
MSDDGVATGKARVLRGQRSSQLQLRRDVLDKRRDSA